MAVLRYFHKPPNPRSDTTTQQISTINNTVSNIQSTLEKKVTKSSGRGLSENNYSTPEKNKLRNIEDGAEVNVQADWNETDTTSDSYIQNKPSVPILDPSGQIPAAYLPSYVDDVIEYNSVVDFPSVGEKGKIYVDASTDIAYRWSGSTYIEISKSIVTGVKGDAETDYRIGNINLTAANIGLSKVVNLDQSKAIKMITRSGTTFTYTCLDGTTGTFTQQDTVYSLPLAADGTRGGIQLGFTQSGRNYPVQLSGEKAYVNVPWTDTNTWPTKLSQLTNDSGYITGITKAMVTTALGYTPPTTDHTYNFAGVSFTSGQSDTGEHNANNIASNGVWYYTSNGPATSLGASTNDGALYSQAYSTSWVGQIAQDYRNGRLFVRGKNNGSWQSWLRVALTGEAQPASDVYAWAKASSKPSYAWGEITSKPDVITTSNISSQDVNSAVKLTSTGYNSTSLSYYQTSNEFDGNSGWCHYIIANHGNGESYYHYTLALPFWGTPKYKRQMGNTSIVTEWYDFITTENMSTSCSIPWSNVTGKPSTFTPSSHTHDYLPLTGGTLTGQLTISNDKYIRVTRTGRGVTFGDGTDTYVGGDTTKMYMWQGKNLPLVFGTNGSERMRVTEFGSLYIGATSYGTTSYKLYVNGSGMFEGNVSAAQCQSRSDLRLKDIQNPSKQINIEDIANAPVITFKWKNKDIDEDVHIGTSAQYWNEILPEAISVSFDGYLSMDYSAAALSSAITVARKTIEHEEKIKQLEDENKQLKEELQSLKSQIKDILAVINSDNN